MASSQLAELSIKTAKHFAWVRVTKIHIQTPLKSEIQCVNFRRASVLVHQMLDSGSILVNL